jgi:archaellum biogenesis protein FlaJ (TadC family)
MIRKLEVRERREESIKNYVNLLHCDSVAIVVVVVVVVVMVVVIASFLTKTETNRIEYS